MTRTVAISLSPNMEREDLFFVTKLLFSPRHWLRGKAIVALEKTFRDYFGVNYAVSFNSGRAAEYALLKVAGIKRGDEVLIQAFTCVVVPNSILWLGAKPVYVDFEEKSLNMSPADLKRKITSKAKAVVVQHTFGKPAKINEIKKIAQKNKLLLIEDCAHSLGAEFQGKRLGVFGEAAFFSFGRDKVISSVFGGMAITNNKKIGEGLLKIQKEAGFPSRFWVFQQLLHPLAFAIILPLYNFFSLGKVILILLQKLGLLSRAVSEEEKQTRQPREYLGKLPNAQAALALSQFQRLARFNQQREKISQIYRDELRIKEVKFLPPLPGEIFMRYTIVTRKAKALIAFAKKRGIVLGDWYQCLVDPRGVDLNRVAYRQGDCPVAEEISPRIVNLPTYPRMGVKEAKRTTSVIKDFFKKND